MSPTRFSEPLQIVELEVPRCSLSFGSSPCTASLADGPYCYQQWGGCLAKAAFNNLATIKWRFMKPQARAMRLYSESAGVTATDPLFHLESVSISQSRLNVGSIRDGAAPLGITGGCTVTLRDQPFDDSVGDPYVGLRALVNTNSGFWAKFFQRVPYLLGVKLNVYEGFWGQTLEQMARRTYLVESASGPDSQDRVVLKAVDPLRLTEAKRASFPPETDMELYQNITDVQTTAVRVDLGTTGDLLGAMGNTNPIRYIVIGQEILSYTGATKHPTAGYWELSGVVRGVLGTSAKAHSVGDGVQRVGRYELMDSWEIAKDLLTFTPVPSEFVDVDDEWSAEASTYLFGYAFSRTVVKPTPVNQLLGELMRDSTFYLWWDERERRIRLKAVRPEVPLVTIDPSDVLEGSFSISREPKERMSRVHIRYNKIDPTGPNEFRNFSASRARIDANEESDLAGAEVINKVIFSEWLTSASLVDEVTLRLLARFSKTPTYVTLSVVGEDFKVADVVNVRHPKLIETEGFESVQRWQVVSVRQVAAGEASELTLQKFIFQALRFFTWMPEGAPDYMSIPEGDREGLLNVGYWCDDDGKLPDGSTGWVWQ